MNKVLLKIHIILFVVSSILTAQTRLIELPGVQPDRYFNASEYTKALSFNSGWEVYMSENPVKRIKIDLPAVFEAEKEFVFEKSFDIPASLSDKNISLRFLGVDYAADFTLNDITIYRHSGGEFPIDIHLPSTLLNRNQPNVLKISLRYFTDPEITIPLKQRFLFPIYRGGFIRDAYIYFRGKISIDGFSQSYQFDYKNKSTNITFTGKLFYEDEAADSLKSINHELVISIFKENGTLIASKVLPIWVNKDFQSFELNLNGLYQWSPERPKRLNAVFVLKEKDKILDRFTKTLSPFETKFTDDGFQLNGKKFALKGAEFVPINDNKRNRDDYYELQIRQIKEAGFNAVRFAKVLPDPFLLSLCERYGLLALVDLPLDGLPESIAEKPDFLKRTSVYLSQMLARYSQYDCVAGYGLGSSYLNNSKIQTNFICSLARETKIGNNKFFYASFIGIPSENIEGLSAYGIEYFSNPIPEIFNELSQNTSPIPTGRLFISEITYPAIYGKSNGYLNEFTNEAQAKYYSDLITFAGRNDISGYFINSFYNYRGSVSSLFGGYSADRKYKIGLVDSPEAPKGFALKVVRSKLSGDGKINIPLGTKDDRSPIYFVIIGLVLAIIMGGLVNTKRKFREDATRALLRSYNFYADIRDHRILSGVHTFILMLILAGAHALLYTVLLYFLRMNILFEKIILSFGSAWFINTISYLAWNPANAFIIIFALSIGLFLILSAVIKAASIFLTQKVLFSNIYFVVVWSFLPLILLLPLELVLHKVLLANIVNLYIYIVVAIFFFWILGRLMKGIYVIYDVLPGRVYSFTALFIAAVLLSYLLYFHFVQSSFYYLITAFKQYPLI